jgi:hypothetical protein
MADQIACLLCDTREFKHVIDTEERPGSVAGGIAQAASWLLHANAYISVLPGRLPDPARIGA